MSKHERPNEVTDGTAEYKVTDRRLFTSDGELREVAGLGDHSNHPAESSAGDAVLSGTSGFAHRSVDEPDGVDFTMLVNAMAEPALLFLGEIPTPDSEQETIDLERARIQIDMLDLLRVRCRGNLSHDEESLLDRVLYQLRMLYVARRNAPQR